jgi:hypothetical protein
VGVDEPFGRRGGAGKDTARLRRGDLRQRPAARGRTPLGRDRVRR